MPVGQNRNSSTLFTSDEHQNHTIGGIDYRPPDVIIGIQCDFQYTIIGHEGNFVPALFTYSKLYFLKHTMNSGTSDNPLPVEKIDFLRSNFCTPIIT